MRRVNQAGSVEVSWPKSWIYCTVCRMQIGVGEGISMPESLC